MDGIEIKNYFKIFSSSYILILLIFIITARNELTL